MIKLVLEKACFQRGFEFFKIIFYVRKKLDRTLQAEK